MAETVTTVSSATSGFIGPVSTRRGGYLQGQLTIRDLIADIDRRQMILPEFQRGYVWKPTQVREFVRSLYRGYPTGSFLIWKTPDPGMVRAGGAPNSDSKYFSLILDGQQRLTSIYTLVTGNAPPFYEGEKLFFNLYFNLQSEEFAYYKKITMMSHPEWIAVTDFFQQGIAKFFAEHNDESEVYLANFEKLQKLDAIINYPYYVDTISEEDINRAVEIFNLVNSKGTRLSASDLALAHICASWPEARQSFRQAQTELSAHHFDFGLDVYTRIAATVATGSGTYDALYNASIEDVRDAWAKGKRAFEYLVNVLRGDAYIDQSRHLKTPFALYPLIVHIARSGGAFSNEHDKRDYLHWMYAALMWGRYSGSSETKLNADLAALDTDDPPALLRENLVKQRGRIRVQPGDLDRAGSTSTFYPMTYIVARSRGARDWFNGAPLYSKAVGAVFGLEAHHIFPQSVLYKSGYSGADNAHKQIVNQIANLAFLTKQANLKISNSDPLGYLREVEKKFPGVLAEQFVPMDESLWAVDRFADFLAERRRLIADGINAFMDQLIAAQPGPERLVSIEDLIESGESLGVEFKSSLRWDYRENRVNKDLAKAVAKTLAAFLNSQGGTLLIGVADDGEILGLDRDFEALGAKGNRDGFELSFRDTIGSLLGEDKNPSIELTFSDVDGKTVALASCQQHHTPVFVEDGDRSEFYVRAGNASRPLDVKEASEFIKAHWPSSSLVGASG